MPPVVFADMRQLEGSVGASKARFKLARSQAEPRLALLCRVRQIVFEELTMQVGMLRYAKHIGRVLEAQPHCSQVNLVPSKPH